MKIIVKAAASGYRAVNLSITTPFDGDIVAVVESDYDSSLEGLKRWDKRFIKKKRFYRADAVTNNGSIRAHDHKGRTRWLYVPDVIECFRKEACHAA